VHAGREHIGPPGEELRGDGDDRVGLRRCISDRPQGGRETGPSGMLTRPIWTPFR
jgi:hypothetical protein